MASNFGAGLSLSDEDYMPVYNEDTLRVHKSFVGKPFVDTNDGSRLFKLKFKPAPTDTYLSNIPRFLSKSPKN
jgi:hypothetical protein